MQDSSEKLFARAAKVIPGGVNSPVRAWKSVGGTPRFVSRGMGPWVWDADGRRYLDFVASWGPLALGHAFPDVVAAVSRAAELGTSFGAPTAGEVELAELLVEALAGADQARLVSTGTEAAMTAVRLARAHTGRRHVIKFAGCYHGHADTMLVRAGSGGLTLGIPDSRGVPPEIASLTRIARYNDLESVREILDDPEADVAAVIVEPIAGNMGTVPPVTGFLEGLRKLVTNNGALLIFDEVITGFRVGWGGAQSIYGVRPDLTCLGKIVGGGLPLAALAGPRGLMEELAPVGPVYQAGTLSGNPIAVAAGLATLRELEKPTSYPRLEQLGRRLETDLRDRISELAKPVCLNRVGSMFTLFVGTDQVRSLEDAQRADLEAFGRYFHGLTTRGFSVPPSQFETAFVSLAHAEEDLSCFAEAVSESLSEALRD